MVDANEDGGVVNATSGQYNLCRDTLQFDVMPISSTGVGEKSDIFTHSPLNLTGTIIIYVIVMQCNVYNL